MPSNYLNSGDFEAYNLPPTTTWPQTQQASMLLDMALGRPEGLVYKTDTAGAPAYMDGLSPTMSFTLQGPISPGPNVQAVLSPAILTADIIGDILILDRGAATLREAVRVISVTGNNTVVFANVLYYHAPGATAEQGLLITEERALPAKRSVTRVAKLPVVNILSCLGRYGYGRRSDQIGGLYQEMNLLAAVQTFGGPPAWINVDPTRCSASPVTGEVWVPAGMLLAYYSEVRLRYVAGFTQANIPGPIKQATAALTNAISSSADASVGGNVKLLRAGDTEIQRFVNSAIGQDTRAMLSVYQARVWV